MELRKHDRYQLRAPTFVFWAPRDGPSLSSEGITRDVSANGVYVNADETPAVGELVQIDILLPNPAPGEPEIHLTAEGVVFRVDALGTGLAKVSGCGFAASVNFYPELSEWVLSHIRGSGPVM